MLFDFSKLKKSNISLVFIITILCIIGAITVFSTTYFPDLKPSQFYYNQLFFYFVGVIIFIFISIFDFKRLNNRYFIAFVFIITLILLIAVLFIGDFAFEARRWIVIGPFTLQPSELVKIASVIITAYALTIKGKIVIEKMKSITEEESKGYYVEFKDLLKKQSVIKFGFSIFSIVVFCLLIILQKSLGNTLMVFGAYLLTLLFTIRFNIKTYIYLIVLIFSLSLSFGVLNSGLGLNFINIDLVIFLIGIIFIFIFYRTFKINVLIALSLLIIFLFASPILNFTYNEVLQPYQRRRVESFLDISQESSLGDNYNREQARLAIGSSSFFGKGFLGGNITNYGYLPFPYTDFAFAAFVEQFGFVGNVVINFIYLSLILKIIKISREERNKFGKMLALGVAMMILVNTVQHIGMNLGLLPITGVPLPLISYGGSALLTVFIGLGLVNAVYIKSEEEKEEVTDLFGEYGIKRR